MALSAHFSYPDRRCQNGSFDQHLEGGSPLQDLSTLTTVDFNGKEAPKLTVSDGNPESHQRASVFHLIGKVSKLTVAAVGKAKELASYAVTDGRNSVSASSTKREPHRSLFQEKNCVQALCFSDSQADRKLQYALERVREKVVVNQVGNLFPKPPKPEKVDVDTEQKLLLEKEFMIHYFTSKKKSNT
ncbi:hypothetical protein SOPP22_04385 [Shewanella sp. OPT22]|nr:hypothetical protein SOPP22_04385 [Shewanella sp. OPT22]